MKIAQINTTCGVGSTGKICVGISQILTQNNIENYILFSNGNNGYPLGIRCSGDKYMKVQALKSRLFGNYGFNSSKATKKMIAELDRINPDIIHLHNIHGHDCNLELLFEYFKRKKTKLIWTFHDCWTFTGYCTYFTMAGCNKWQHGCENCIQRRNFSWFFDKSAALYKKKRELFENLDLTIVTPSKWLADMVKQSFFKEYPVQVIYNGIDLNTFKPTSNGVKEKYGLENKNIALGVSFEWGPRKGLDAMISLSKNLPKDYQLVLVGTNNEVDKLLPSNILSIHRTNNPQELAGLYSAASLLVNPTRDEVMGLVNIEALACGTPGVTYNSGGSPECYDETCGSVVDCDDVKALEREIIRICTERPYSKESCIHRAQMFDQNIRFGEYLDLYRQVFSK